MTCDDRRLDRLLREDDEESAEYRQAAAHLEHCPRCRERIEQLSSDVLLAEACQTLRALGDLSLDAVVPPSIAISVEPLLGEDVPVECESVTLDFLEPARHPELLGRLGRYDVERLIGAGGMGVVLKGFDTELHRVVAIKALLPHLANSAAARRRFARESRAAAAVVHEHVIPIYDVESEGPHPYLVMQFVPGHSLQARVDEQGPLEIKDVLRIARQAASGLAAAHAQGVVHRDVKPANILLEDSVDRVLISDFGLARTMDDATLTRTGMVAGTPHYMSPEQAAGHSVGQQSDLFSLGGVIYFMCTGRPPYRADSAMAVLNRICHEPHTPLDDVNVDVPIELAELVDRLLEKDPAQRIAVATEVETRCAGLLADLQQGKRPRRRRWLRGLRGRRLFTRRMMIALLAAPACMAIGSVATWVIVQSRRPTSAVVEREPRFSETVPVRAASAPSDELKQTVRGASKPTSDSPRLSAGPSNVAASKPSEIPPDTFAEDLLEVSRRLAIAENDLKRAITPPTNVEDNSWQLELDKLRAGVLALERRASSGSMESTQQDNQTPPASSGAKDQNSKERR